MNEPTEGDGGHESADREKVYALCQDGYIRCANCEAKINHPHEPGCTGGSLLLPVRPS